MNESKSSRYHRLARRAGFLSLACSALLLVVLLGLRLPVSAPLYAAILLVLNELVTLPILYYRSYVLEHRYELSTEPVSAWLRDQAKALGLNVAIGAPAAWLVYRLIAWSAEWWWLAAALAGAGLALVFARLAPVLILPLFYRFTPLERPELRARLMELSRRAGVPVLGVFEWGLGTKTRRANAALVGSGATRRILLSDTLLAEYSDDEIEVILAHELAHHAHRDIPKGILLEFLVLLAGSFAAAVALSASWEPLGLKGHADPAGMPVLLLAGGIVMLGATPLVNAFSRFNERRADAFALALTRRGDAFVSAMRRIAAQNLAEESPSRTSVWLFHTHPPIEERIARAKAVPDGPSGPSSAHQPIT